MKHLIDGMDFIGRHHSGDRLALGGHDILLSPTHHETKLEVVPGRKDYLLSGQPPEQEFPESPLVKRIF
jgi:hypothetical protein